MATPTTAPPVVPASFEQWSDWYALALATSQVVTTLPFTQEPTTASLSGNVLTLTSSFVRADVVPSDPADATDNQVFTIPLAGIAQARVVAVGILSDAEPVFLKHLAMGGAPAAGQGELEIVGGTGVTIDSVGKFVFLQRSGSRLKEVFRIGFGADFTQITSNIDFNNHAAIGSAEAMRDQAGSTYTLNSATDPGTTVNLTDACVVTLPSDGTWVKGMRVTLRCGGSSLSVTSAGTIRNPNNHTEAKGQYARVQAVVVSDSPTVWDFFGATKATGGGGGGGGAIQRVSTWISDAGTLRTAVPGVAGTYGTPPMLTLSTTPANGETWLYFASGQTFAQGGLVANPCTFRLRRSADADGPKVGSSIFTSNLGLVSLVAGYTYSGTPGAQNWVLEAAPGNTTQYAQVAKPSLVALRLETGEFCDLVAGPVPTVPTHTNDVDVVTSTHTTAADDYVVLSWGEWSCDNANGGVVKVLVDGSSAITKKMAKSITNPGFFVSLEVRTFTAASHTVTLQIASNGAYACGMSRCGVAWLKKSLFEEFWSTTSDAEDTSTVDTTVSTKLTLAQALTSGAKYLLLADALLGSSSNANGANIHTAVTLNDAALYPEAKIVPADAAISKWCAEPVLFSGVVQRSIATDSFKLTYNGQSASGATATISEATMALLRLGDA